MTDGILICSVKIGDVDMSFLDFAGQEEYDYTHPLFLKPEAVYLVVHNPRTDGLHRTEEFFDMIANKAPQAEVIVEFCITYDSFAEKALTMSIDEDSLKVAKELFCHWGMLFELSNGDLVLQPQ
eukprot:gene48592-biopygen12736